MIDRTIIEAANAAAEPGLRAEYDALGEQLDRRGLAIDSLKARVAAYGIAIPSWGVGTGGTRFARFPGAGEPAGIFDKLDDCGVIHRLTAATPRVSLHVPWDLAPAADLRASSLASFFCVLNSARLASSCSSSSECDASGTSSTSTPLLAFTLAPGVDRSVFKFERMCLVLNPGSAPPNANRYSFEIERGSLVSCFSVAGQGAVTAPERRNCGMGGRFFPRSILLPGVHATCSSICFAVRFF